MRAVLTLQACITLVVLAMVLGCLVGGWLAPELVALLAAGALIATRVLSPADALAGFGGPALLTLLLGGLYSLSVALQQSGLAALAANRLLAAIHGWPAYGALVAVYGLTLIATELLSNAAAVALVLPIAANLAPGRYRFLDVLRYGWPLSLLFAVAVPAMVLRLG